MAHNVKRSPILQASANIDDDSIYSKVCLVKMRKTKEPSTGFLNGASEAAKILTTATETLVSINKACKVSCDLKKSPSDLSLDCLKESINSFKHKFSAMITMPTTSTMPTRVSSCLEQHHHQPQQFILTGLEKFTSSQIVTERLVINLKFVFIICAFFFLLFELN